MSTGLNSFPPKGRESLGFFQPILGVLQPLAHRFKKVPHSLDFYAISRLNFQAGRFFISRLGILGFPTRCSLTAGQGVRVDKHPDFALVIPLASNFSLAKPITNRVGGNL